MDRILLFAVGGNLVDSATFIIGNVDATKKLTFQVDNQTTATDLTLNTGAQTDNVTLTVPTLTGPATLPTMALMIASPFIIFY